PACAGLGLPSTTNPYMTGRWRWWRKDHTPRKNDEGSIGRTGPVGRNRELADAVANSPSAGYWGREAGRHSPAAVHSRSRHLPVIQETECGSIPEQGGDGRATTSVVEECPARERRSRPRPSPSLEKGTRRRRRYFHGAAGCARIA